MRNYWEGLRFGRLLPFSAGAVSAALLFLTVVAFAGSLTALFIPPLCSVILNALIGAAISGFGLRMLLKKGERKGWEKS